MLWVKSMAENTEQPSSLLKLSYRGFVFIRVCHPWREISDSHSSRNVSLQRMRPSHALASLPVRIFAMRPLHFTLVP